MYSNVSSRKSTKVAQLFNPYSCLQSILTTTKLINLVFNTLMNKYDVNYNENIKRKSIKYSKDDVVSFKWVLLYN